MNDNLAENQPASNRKFFASLIVIGIIYVAIILIIKKFATGEISAIASPALFFFAAEVFRRYEHLNLRIQPWNVVLLLFCFIGAELLLTLLFMVLGVAFFMGENGILSYLLELDMPTFLLTFLVTTKAPSCLLVAYVGGRALTSLQYIEVSFAVILQLLLQMLILMIPLAEESGNLVKLLTTSDIYYISFFLALYVVAALMGLRLVKRATAQVA